MTKLIVNCPRCGSKRVYRDGLRYLPGGATIQRWLCRNCGFRFSESSVKRDIVSQILEALDSRNDNHEQRIIAPSGSVEEVLDNLSFSVGENVASHRLAVVGKALSNLPYYSSKHRIGVTETKVTENLVTVKPLNERQAGATETSSIKQKLEPKEIKGKLVEFAWFMQKQGYRPATVTGRREILESLVKNGLGPDLLNPDAVKGFIAKQQSWEDGYKRNVVYAYTTFLAMHGISWNPPKYRVLEKLPFIPLEAELDQLITSAGKRMSIFLQGLKETAADPGELFALKWVEINPQVKTITLNHPVKGHRPRIVNVSSELIDRLNTLPKTSENVFRGNIRSLRRSYHDQRKTAARKLNNPRLLEINFTTFRHWKATMEYHKTKDVLWIMKLLGHHSLRVTLSYIDLEKALFKETDDAFTVKVAEDLDEACKLLEAGFEYVTDMEGKKLFRKRK